MPTFFHEKLDVYHASLEFVVAADALLKRTQRGHAYLTDQLRRAATSIVLNIAEGAGEFSTDEKARFYRMARRSATECAAILDIFGMIRIADETELKTGKELLDRVVAMLTRMQGPGKAGRASNAEVGSRRASNANANANARRGADAGSASDADRGE